MDESDVTRKRRSAQADGIAQGAAQFGGVAAINAAAASDYLPQGRAAIERMLLGEVNKLHSTDAKYASVHRAQACGNVAEAMNDLVANRRLREQGLKGQWQNTRLKGDNRNPADSILEIDGQIVGMRQDKYLKFDGNTRDQNLRSLANEKYNGMDLCVPSDRLDVVRSGLRRLAQKETDPTKRAQLLDAERRVVGGVPCDDVQNLAKEATIAAGSAALAAGILTGAFSTIQNAIHVQSGKLTAKEAIIASATDAGRSAARAGGQAGLGVAIRTTSSRLGVQGLAKAGPAMNLSFAFVETGLAVFDFVQGTASGNEVAARLGQTACSTVASLYAGGAAAAVFGKVGLIKLSIVGVTAPVSLPVLAASTAASIVASLAYQASIRIFETASLDIEKANRIIAMANAAEESLSEHRENLRCAIAECIRDRQAEFDNCFSALESGLGSGDLSATIGALCSVAQITGGTLKFQSFDDFDEFMCDQSTTLIL
jgi:hypothetical protein